MLKDQFLLLKALIKANPDSSIHLHKEIENHLHNCHCSEGALQALLLMSSESAAIISASKHQIVFVQHRGRAWLCSALSHPGCVLWDALQGEELTPNKAAAKGAGASCSRTHLSSIPQPSRAPCPEAEPTGDNPAGTGTGSDPQHPLKGGSPQTCTGQRIRAAGMGQCLWETTLTPAHTGNAKYSLKYIKITESPLGSPNPTTSPQQPHVHQHISP